MTNLRVTSPAKINLHLEVLGLRGDGFHELATVMQTIDLHDVLELSCNGSNHFELQTDVSGLPTDATNLVLRAAEALAEAYPAKACGIHFTLHKHIPIGAGLAGGSSNAAAALVGLNTLWGLGLTLRQLEPFAASLGSDVCFCLAGGTQLCFGRGECLESLPPLQTGAVLLLKQSGVSVSTPWVFGLFREQFGYCYLKGESAFMARRTELRCSPLVTALKNADTQGLGRALYNDLEEVVRPHVPSVTAGLKLLQECKDCQMTGSGPSLFGLFRDHATAEVAQCYLAKEVGTLGMESWVCGFHPDGIRIL